MERTLLIIKPDAVARGLVGRIISRFEDKDFKIKRIESRLKDAAWCKIMYGHLINTLIYTPLVDFMTSDFLIGIVLEGINAVSCVRDMIGSTNSYFANPGTVRGDFGSGETRFNCVHASDTVSRAENEISLFFRK